MSKTQDDSSELKEGLDYYWEGPYVVFTAHFLKRRGRCCDTGCRHCPYKPKPADDAVQTGAVEKPTS